MALSKILPAGQDQFAGARNLIINGAMNVAQRGTSSTANGFGCVDRFRHGWNGGTRTFSQETLSSGDPYDSGFRNFFRLTNTTAGSTNTTDYVESWYKIEAQDVASSGWNYTSANSYVTLSFWVRVSVAGTYSVWIRDEDATSYKYGFTYTVAADTWTKVTHSIAGNSNLVFNNDNGAGLRLQWMAFYGSNYTSSSPTLNAWTTGDAIPDYATTWNTTAGATFDFTGVQLEVGDTATPFEHRSYGDELARCQRYYKEWSGNIETAGRTKNGTTTCNFVLEMRATPTVTFDAAYAYCNNTGYQITAIVANSSQGNLATTHTSFSSTNVGDAASLFLDDLKVDAEL